MAHPTAQQAPIPLSAATLPALSPAITTPQYDRTQLTPGIVHIGLGNFHRAHQAWYLHRLMQAGQAWDWAIIGAGVRPYDVTMRQTLLAQDCLSTLIELDPAGISAEVIGPMIDYLPITEGLEPLIDAMADPRIRIVSLTVTEGGYYLDPTTGALDLDHTDIRYDIAHPDQPCTAFGAMVAALKRRWSAGDAPFTGQSCDNLRGNGDILRRVVLGLAAATAPDLAAWVVEKGAFPNSMVDCIVPATGPNEIAQAAALGIGDGAPVTHENFRQWVMEERFCNGRPPWEQAGATITADVHAYEAMKIQMLNAGHQVLANLGELLSLPTIDLCMAHPLVAAFFDRVQQTEIVPCVAPVPGMTPAAYLALIKRRFANPSIKDTTRRVAFDGSARHTGFVLPLVHEGLAAGRSIEGLCLVEALWARMCAGTRENGSAIAPNDPHWDDLQRVALTARDRPQAWLEQRRYYGDLADNSPFAPTFAHWLSALWTDGCTVTVSRFLQLEER